MLLVRNGRPLWPFAWFAPAPVLAFSFGALPLVSAVAAFLSYGLGCLAFARLSIGAIPIPVVVIFSLIGSGVFFAIAVLLARRAVQRLAAWQVDLEVRPPNRTDQRSF